MFYKNAEFKRADSKEIAYRQFQNCEAQILQRKLFEDAYSWSDSKRNNLSVSAEKHLPESALKEVHLNRRQLIQMERLLLAEIYLMAVIYMAKLNRYYRPQHNYHSFRHWMRPRTWLHQIDKTANTLGHQWHELGESGFGLTNRLIADAHHNLGRPVWAFTKFASVCQSGNLGCAATVSELLQEAGVKIAGSAGVYGVVNQLDKLGWKKIKIEDKSQFRPGDVVFGLRGSHGHIGVISAVKHDQILVCDNSSRSGTLKERTIESGGSFTPNGRFAGNLYVMRNTSG